jgi:hypothetical protein
MDNVTVLKKGGKKVRALSGPGWYIMAMYAGKRQALQELRFARESDARRAVAALTAAKLDSVSAMTRAGAQRVLEIACSAMQW